MILTLSAEVVLEVKSVVVEVTVLFQLLGVEVDASSVDVILCDVDDADVQVELSDVTVGEETVELVVIVIEVVAEPKSEKTLILLVHQL